MTPRSKKNYRACNNTSFILRTAWTVSSSTDRGRGLPSFLPPARTGLLDSIQLLVHLWKWKASLSRLLAATQQEWVRMTWGLFNKEGLTWVWLPESNGYDLWQKLLWLILSYKLFSSKCDIDNTIQSTVAVQPKEKLTNHPNVPTIPNPGYSNPMKIHATHNREHVYHDSSTLCRGCTHFSWVTIILGSPASVDPTEYLYTLPGCALRYHYKAFWWLLLVCSAATEVSPEVSV
jgi:hypothetical protein